MEFIIDKNGISMSEMDYYYGRHIKIDEDSKYLDIFYKKIAYAKETIDSLQKCLVMTRDLERINRCQSAIGFNIKFIEETGAKYSLKSMNSYYNRDV